MWQTNHTKFTPAKKINQIKLQINRRFQELIESFREEQINDATLNVIINHINQQINYQIVDNTLYTQINNKCEIDVPEFETN